jgi:hypothetical protein
MGYKYGALYMMAQILCTLASDINSPVNWYQAARIVEEIYTLCERATMLGCTYIGCLVLLNIEVFVVDMTCRQTSDKIFPQPDSSSAFAVFKLLRYTDKLYWASSACVVFLYVFLYKTILVPVSIDGVTVEACAEARGALHVI